MTEAANPGNTCAHLEVGNCEHPEPYLDMMHRQLMLQDRLNKIPAADMDLAARAGIVIYWRHCIHTECDELLDWINSGASPGSGADIEAEMEVVDIMHFVFNVGISLGISPAELQAIMCGSVEFPACPREFFNKNNVETSILRLSKSLTNLIDLLPWKSWKNYANYSHRHDVLVSNFAEVVTSCMYLAGAVGMDKTRVYNVYCAKNKENHARQDRGY